MLRIVGERESSSPHAKLETHDLITQWSGITTEAKLSEILHLFLNKCFRTFLYYEQIMMNIITTLSRPFWNKQDEKL